MGALIRGQDSSSGAVSVIKATSQALHTIEDVNVPRTGITPTVAGVATAEILLDAGNTGGSTPKELLSAVFTVGATDSVSAGAAIVTPRTAEVITISPGETLTLHSDTAFTDIFAVGISATDDAAKDNAIAYGETDLVVDIRPQLTQFEFAAADSVKSIVVSLSPAFGDTQTATRFGQYALLNIRGRSHG